MNRDPDKCVNQHAQGCRYVAGNCDSCKLYSEDDHIQRQISEHWVSYPVRCKGCRYWTNIQDSNGEWLNWCELNGSGWKADGYCSKGRMRDES